ncbi:MAG: hypothetical protein AAF392_02085 [Bacteroidota bacterium]
MSVALDMIGRMFGKAFSRVLVDRGYRGHEKVGESGVILPLPGSCSGERVYSDHRLGQIT